MGRKKTNRKYHGKSPNRLNCETHTDNLNILPTFTCRVILSVIVLNLPCVTDMFRSITDATLILRPEKVHLNMQTINKLSVSDRFWESFVMTRLWKPGINHALLNPFVRMAGYSCNYSIVLKINISGVICIIYMYYTFSKPLHISCFLLVRRVSLIWEIIKAKLAFSYISCF